MKAAMAMEKAADAQGATGEAMGAGIGLMLPAMFARFLDNGSGRTPGATAGPDPAVETATCPDCRQAIPARARFCPYCGHQQLVFRQCAQCGKNLAPNAKFCPRCGQPADQKPAPWQCAHCGAENLAGALFCNQCGEKK
jgi:membrane protease subunit (stomatin/prohibitin family)